MPRSSASAASSNIRGNSPGASPLSGGRANLLRSASESPRSSSLTLREFTGRAQPSSVLRAPRAGVSLDNASGAISGGRSAGGLRELISSRSREATLKSLAGSTAPGRAVGRSILDPGAREGGSLLDRGGRSIDASRAIGGRAARIPSVGQAQALPANRNVSSSIVRDDWSRAVANARLHREFDHHDHFGGHFGHYYGHHHHGYDHHGHHGFHLGIYYGFPYFGYSFYHHGYYRPWYSLYVSYPYVGYYGYYDYPYLGHYGCDFYSGFYVRFGPARASYYSACSGFGYHHHPHHHAHTYDCSVHGSHTYHVRDCSLCYPAGETHYEYHQADGAAPYAEPEAAPAQGQPAPPAEAIPESPLLRGATPESAPAVAERIEPAPAEVRVDPLAGLSPAKLTFALGLLAFEKGEYEEAAEHFFNASIEDSESGVVKLFLAVSLVAIAEHDYAPFFLRKALDGERDLARHPLDLARFYGEDRGADLDKHRALLAERAELFPSDAGVQLLRGFIALGAGDLEQAGVGLHAFRQLAGGADDRALADRMLAEVLERQGIEPPAGLAGEPAEIARGSAATAEAAQESAAIADFLADPRLEAVRALPIR